MHGAKDLESFGEEHAARFGVETWNAWIVRVRLVPYEGIEAVAGNLGVSTRLVEEGDVRRV
ncbi:MAG: hypothetical protein AAGA56_08700 [Myxococcota bacterium]